jgi:tetratricopeptide (TPR) repeat protein
MSLLELRNPPLCTFSRFYRLCCASFCSRPGCHETGSSQFPFSTVHLCSLFARDGTSRFLALGAALGAVQKGNTARSGFIQILARFGGKFTRSISAHALHGVCRTRLGYAYAADDDLESAIALFREEVSRRPADPEAHGHLGRVLMRNGDLDEAIAAFREELRLKPDDLRAEVDLAKCIALKRQEPSKPS